MNAQLDELERRIKANIAKNNVFSMGQSIEDPDRNGWLRAMKKVLEAIHEIKNRK